MNSIILLPFLLSKVFSLAISSPNNMLLQAPRYIQGQSFFKLCFEVKYTTNKLQEISIPKKNNEPTISYYVRVMAHNKTEEAESEEYILTDPSKACAVEIYKNQTSGLFVFDYKIVPLTTCNNSENSQIICDTGTNCTKAIKCCDFLNDRFCINTFTLKKIMPNKTQYNNNINSCATANNTNCFSIVQMYNFTKSADIIADSTTKAPSHNTTTVPANSQQSVNISFLQLIYFSIASLLAGL